MVDSKNFIQAHGIAIAKNGWIKNAVIESLKDDPELIGAGRLWYNETDNVYKGSFISDDDTIIAKAFSTKEELDKFIDLLLSDSGTDLVGFGGYKPTTGSFEISGGTLTTVLEKLIDKTAEIDDKLGSGEISSGVEVFDESVQVIKVSKKMNFIGKDVLAIANKDGDGVDIYIPSPDFAPMYNKDTAIVEDNVTVNRKLASNSGGSYQIGDWIPGTIYPTTNITTLSFTPPVKIGFADDKTSVEVKVYGADDTSVIATRLLENISGDLSSSTENGIELTVSEWESDLFRYKANLDVKIHINEILPNGGRFSVEVIHHNATLGDFSKKQGPIMFDWNGGEANIETITIEGKTPKIKQISGLNYYGLNSTFGITLQNIDNINALTWPTDDIVIKAKESEIFNYFGISLYNIKANSTEITDWTNVWNASNLTSESDRVTTRKNFRYIGEDAVAAFTVVAKMDKTTDFSSDKSAIMIDTYDGLSTNQSEEFTDEVYRLQENLVDKWDSSKLLENNELMVFNDQLQRKFGSWVKYKPTNTADYSADTNETQYFYREFTDPDVSHSNGLFNIGNITEDDLTSGRVKIEISTNKTDWFDCSKDYTSGVLANGDGCRINKDTNSLPKLEFTLGTGGSTDSSTGSAGYGLFVRISMPSGSTVKMNHIKIVNW